jgi:N-formylglutamate amidohydrolase
MTDVPPWVVFHVPHDSTHIPADVRHQFSLDDAQLEHELLEMTDHKTLELFASGVALGQVIRAPVSRLVLDVERFEHDQFEPMALRGMGAVYTKTHDGQTLRHPLTDSQRQKLLEDWYRPHHAALTVATQTALHASGLAVIIDCHSFPAMPLPYEVDQTARRAQICIGTDAFHTPATLAQFLSDALAIAGYEVGLDSPFSGSMVPTAYFKKDRRVISVMLEVRRDLYLLEQSGSPNTEFERISAEIRQCLLQALHRWHMLEFGRKS